MKTRTNTSDVIESSKSLFGKHGFKKVTMTDIASAAQISRPTLYSLYSDKDAVFAACILSHIDDFRSEAELAMGSEKSAHRQLRVLFEIYVQKPFAWYFESEAFDMLVNASLYAPTEMAMYWKDFEEAIRSVLSGHSKNLASSAKEIAKVLACFARDARSSAKHARDLERLVETAIVMALGR